MYPLFDVGNKIMMVLNGAIILQEFDKSSTKNTVIFIFATLFIIIFIYILLEDK